MLTPAAAIAWEFRRRHRWGLTGILAAILILAAIKVAVTWNRTQFEVRDLTFALLVPTPMAATFLYLLAIFTFGISGDLAARESMFPRRLLTLPVSSAALAGLPMLYGSVSMTLLWFAIRAAAMFPPGAGVPRYWPALFAVSLLAWTQALTWMPYPFRGARIAVSIVLLLSIDVVVFTALEYRARETTMLLLLAPWTPLAYLTAWSAIRRARRGDAPEWRSLERLMPAFAGSAEREFSSAARAQLWFEWRQFGRSLPVLVSIVLPAGLALLFLFHQTPQIVVEIVAGALLLPPLLATFVAATAGKTSANTSAAYGITPFIAARPVEDRDLVLAKWKAALLSTAAAWMIVAVSVPLAVLWSDAAEPIVDVARDVDSALGRPRAIVLATLVVLGLVTATWKQLVQGLYVGMSGRDWAVKGIAFATLTIVTLGFFATAWIFESRVRVAAAWNAIPWVMAALVGSKLVLAAAVMKRSVDSGLFSRRQLMMAAIVWDVCVLSLYGVLTAILPAILVRRHYLLLVAILAVPFVRLMAAPLAVAGNRHR